MSSYICVRLKFSSAITSGTSYSARTGTGSTLVRVIVIVFLSFWRRLGLPPHGCAPPRGCRGTSGPARCLHPSSKPAGIQQTCLTLRSIRAAALRRRGSCPLRRLPSVLGRRIGPPGDWRVGADVGEGGGTPATGGCPAGCGHELVLQRRGQGQPLV